MSDIRDWITETFNTSKDSFLDTLNQLGDSVAEAAPIIIKSAIIVAIIPPFFLMQLIFL